MLKIFHRGSINLIKSLSTIEIKIVLTFGKRIIISFKEIWLAQDVEWGFITKSERKQSIYKCIKVSITLANESIRVRAKIRIKWQISVPNVGVLKNFVMKMTVYYFLFKIWSRLLAHRPQCWRSIARDPSYCDSSRL